MKFKWMMLTVSLLVYCLFSITGLHANISGANKMNITNCTIFSGDIADHQSHLYTTINESPDIITAGPDSNITNICLASYVGENITLITNRVASMHFTDAETQFELLNKSVLRTHVVHVCDTECEDKFIAGHIYVKSDIHKESQEKYFMRYFTNFKCTDESPIDSKSLEYYLIFVSFGFICISVVSFSFYVVKFISNKSLRTLPGSCIFSASVANLILYGCFFAFKISPHNEVNKVICPVQLYMSFASWFWINVISFDLWKSIRMAIVKFRRPTEKSIIMRFVYYSIYAWGMPLVLTFLVFYPFSSDQRIIYNGGFSSQFKSLAELFVAIPLAILQLSNFALFYSSYHMIFRGSKSKSQSEQSEVPTIKRNFSFFFRLSFVVITVWIFCIIGYIANIEILVYVYFYAKILEAPYIVWNYAVLGKDKYSLLNCPGCCTWTKKTETT